MGSRLAIGQVVDIVRSCNLRALNAHNRSLDLENGEARDTLLYWRDDVWYKLKYRVLVKAIKMRRGGVKGIRIGCSPDDRLSSDHRERLNREKLIFVFKTESIPYRTETTLHNLTRLVPREKLMVLLEPFDYISAKLHVSEKRIFVVSKQ